MSDRTDEETLELIREWLQQYGLTIIIGLVLGLSAIGGYRYWQGKQAEQRYNESAQLNTILQALEQNKPQDAASAYDSLLKEGGEIAELAALNMAGAYRKENKNDDAMAALKLAAASKDELLAQSARWQLALMLAAQGNYDEALQQSEQLRDSAYAAQAAALQGYIHDKQGKSKDALAAYERSQQLAPAPATALQINALQARLALEGNGQ